MTNDTVNNVYRTILKQKQSSLYSKTVLYNDNSTVNTSITGLLLPNTTYTCCVLAVTSYGARVACYQMGMVWKEESGINCFIYKRNLHYILYRIEYYSNLDMAST